MDFLVKRDDLRECRTVERKPAEPGPGQALLGVSAFGLTANNITYAVFGETMSYWDFFPTEDGWGRVPVWGFADVVASRCDGVEEGTRIYGYLPPSSELLVSPDHVDERGFVDASPHRAGLPSAYNGYLHTEADPFYDSGNEDIQMLLRPLFFTSFLIDDFLEDNASFGADVAVLSSASSKTALSAAHLIAKRGGTELIGLTSAPRVGWLKEIHAYNSVLPYEDIDWLPKSEAVYIDMAGDAAVRDAVHRHYGDKLLHDAVVGATHWEQSGGNPAARGSGAEGAGENPGTPGREAEDVPGINAQLPGPKPTLFFAPDRVSKRSGDWGREDLERRVADAWRPFAQWAGGWLQVEHGKGPAAVERAYRQLLEGGVDPATGHVLTPG
jgi:hypothetical protein